MIQSSPGTEEKGMPDLSFYEEIKTLRYLKRAMPEVITRAERIEGEEWFLVFDDLQQKLYKFRGNAGRIWEMLNGENTVEAVVAELAKTEGVARDTLLADVSRFILKAGKKGLIKAALKKVHA
jgi:hypothetical protein